jgi:hypothetical protein
VLLLGLFCVNNDRIIDNYLTTGSISNDGSSASSIVIDTDDDPVRSILKFGFADDNDIKMHDYLLHQKQKRSERAARAYQKRLDKKSKTNTTTSISSSDRAPVVADTNKQKLNTKLEPTKTSAYKRIDMSKQNQWMQLANTPVERLHRIEWFLDEYRNHRHNHHHHHRREYLLAMIIEY